jgi:hypothetical protein
VLPQLAHGPAATSKQALLDVARRGWVLVTRRRAREGDGFGPGRRGASRSPAAYPANRRSTIDALCPPKPDEFETATPTSASRASFGT